MKTILQVAITGLCMSMSPLSSAQQALAGGFNAAPERVGNYRTREERREAGLGTELTSWLTFSGLVEVESIREVTSFNGELSDHYDFATDPAVQAAFDISLWDIFEAELIFEYTEDSRDPIMDELIVSADLGNIGFSTGRYYAPFGLYYSHFINGPFLEFAETRRDIVQVDYDFEDRVEFAVFGFDGKTRKLGSSRDDTGWGAAIDSVLVSGRLNLGIGFISNLAESDEEFLREENDLFRRKVGAWNAYAVYEADNWDVSLEIMRATDRFRELERSRDKPEAWNLESAYYLSDNFEVALRYERSNELIDAPGKQYGMALTWRLANKISITTEYLRARYQSGFVEEDDDVFAERGNTLAVWFAFEF